MDLITNINTITHIKDYVKENEWSGIISAKKLFALMYHLIQNNCISKTPQNTWESNETYESKWESAKIEFFQKSNGADKTLMFRDSSGMRVMNQVINEVAIITDICEYDFSEFELNDRYDAGIGAFLKYEFEKDITIHGSIIMRYALSSFERKCAKHLIIKGKFTLMPASDRDINLPEKLRVPPFDCIIEGVRTHYESAAAYQNRDSRLTRLRENKAKRDAMKNAKEKGMISIPDYYGVPLDIGSTVAFCWGGTCRQGIVEGQTAVRIIVREPGSQWTVNCRSCEVLRI